MARIWGKIIARFSMIRNNLYEWRESVCGEEKCGGISFLNLNKMLSLLWENVELMHNDSS